MDNSDMAAYMKKRRHEFKRKLKERLGGVCAQCGSSDDLVFDHVDPDTKEIDPCFLADYGKEKQEAEIAKLQILCVSCHGSKNHRDAENFFSESVVCECGRYCDNRYSYAGHKAWCDG